MVPNFASQGAVSQPRRASEHVGLGNVLSILDIFGEGVKVRICVLPPVGFI